MEQVKFIYSTDFYSINDAQLTGCCGHMICLEEGAATKRGKVEDRNTGF